MKQVLQQLLEEAVMAEFKLELKDTPRVVLSHPPKPEMGDYASNAALVLAKELKMSPRQVAEQLVSSISESNLQSPISNLTVIGGFINFTLNTGKWGGEVLGEIGNQKSDYGNSVSANLENVMVEYLSPNTNKPLHLGHLRNGILGVSVIKLFSAIGHHVVKAGIINDKNVAICKAMLAYERWGGGRTPELVGQKPDHFVGEYYVRFAQEVEKNPGLQEEAQDMLRKWEAGDPEVKKLWERMREWVMLGWKQTENTLGFFYDKIYFESDVYEQGKDIVQEGLNKNVFRKNEKGNVVFDLATDEFGLNEDGSPRVLTVIRSDGTSLYTTQDLGLAVRRAKELGLDRLIFVVASEQRFHFQALFAMLKALGYSWAKNLHHLWYGMVYLPEGKMKSREGTVVDADDLIREMQGLAKNEIESRIQKPEGVDSGSLPNAAFGSGITEEELSRRAMIIALAAIKFYFLRQKATSDIHFDPKESISFEGFTGPYCLYSYARAKSILRAEKLQMTKAASFEAANLNSGTMQNELDLSSARSIVTIEKTVKVSNLGGGPEGICTPRTSNDKSSSTLRPVHSSELYHEQIDYSGLNSSEERMLVRQLEEFPEFVRRAAAEYNPALIATFVFDTCQNFNTFYTKHNVLKAESEIIKNVRLALVNATAQVIKNGLGLLGIETLEEM